MVYNITSTFMGFNIENVAFKYTISIKYRT